MYRNKGTITVFLSLISMLFLSLFCTMAESARVQAARFQAATAFDMGVFSMFGEYDRVLLEDYDLWFLDCEDRSGRKIKDVLETGITNYIIPNICPGNDIKTAGRFEIFPMEITSCNVEQYALATDQSGQVFYRQVIQNQKELFVGEAALALRKNIKDVQSGQKKGEQYKQEEKKADEAYQKAEEQQKEAEQKEAEQKEAEEKETEKEKVPEEKKAENPLDQIKKIKKMGILSLVMKDASKVSDKEIERKDLPSERTLQKGNSGDYGDHPGAASEAVFLKYLGDYFTCAAEKENTKGKGSRKHALSYELEYIIGGKKSDVENLKKTVQKILLIREGVNYMYIAKNAEMRSEAMALAAAIAGAAAVPALASALQRLLMLAWAYGESLLDVRSLLAGGKIPPVKTRADWRLSLDQLGKLTEVLEKCDAGQGKGQSYHDYLLGLVALTGKKQRNMRALDLIEENRRQEKGGENFQVDTLAEKVKVNAEFELSPVFLRVPAVWMQVKNQGTNYKIRGQYSYMEGGA